MSQGILIVEDEGIVAEDLAGKISKLGYPVSGIAAEAQAAVAMALRLRPQLILMDINLGGESDGIEAATRIREQFDIPVIYLTAYSDPATLARAKITSPFGYILKPIEMRELAIQLELVLYRHKAEAKLRESESRYRQLFIHSPDAIFVNLDDRITMVNASCLLLFAAGSEEELLGKSPYELFHADFHPLMRERINRMRQFCEPAARLEEKIVRLDGKVVDVEVISSPFPLEGRTAIHVILRDITELKRARHALEQSNRELEEFAYAVSHDLQEPLRSVIGFLQLLQTRCKNTLDATATAYIDRSVSSSRRLQTMIKELLALSRVATKKLGFDILDLNLAVREVVENLSLIIKEKNAEISLAELPRVRADATQIGSLFQNLIMNALKYNESPHPTVAIGCQELPDAYLFFVKDNGIGIDPRFHARIFQVFQRLHSAREYSGMGMGLAFCKKIVERHGGEISVDSAPGQGSTLYFRLPKRGGLGSDQVSGW